MEAEKCKVEDQCECQDSCIKVKSPCEIINETLPAVLPLAFCPVPEKDPHGEKRKHTSRMRKYHLNVEKKLAYLRKAPRCPSSVPKITNAKIPQFMCLSNFLQRETETNFGSRLSSSPCIEEKQKPVVSKYQPINFCEGVSESSSSSESIESVHSDFCDPSRMIKTIISLHPTASVHKMDGTKKGGSFREGASTRTASTQKLNQSKDQMNYYDKSFYTDKDIDLTDSRSSVHTKGRPKKDAVNFREEATAKSGIVNKPSIQSFKKVHEPKSGQLHFCEPSKAIETIISLHPTATILEMEGSKKDVYEQTSDEKTLYVETKHQEQLFQTKEDEQKKEKIHFDEDATASKDQKPSKESIQEKPKESTPKKSKSQKEEAALRGRPSVVKESIRTSHVITEVPEVIEPKKVKSNLKQKSSTKVPQQQPKKKRKVKIEQISSKRNIITSKDKLINELLNEPKEDSFYYIDEPSFKPYISGSSRESAKDKKLIDYLQYTSRNSQIMSQKDSITNEIKNNPYEFGNKPSQNNNVINSFDAIDSYYEEKINLREEPPIKYEFTLSRKKSIHEINEPIGGEQLHGKSKPLRTSVQKARMSNDRPTHIHDEQAMFEDDWTVMHPVAEIPIYESKESKITFHDVPLHEEKSNIPNKISDDELQGPKKVTFIEKPKIESYPAPHEESCELKEEVKKSSMEPSSNDLINVCLSGIYDPKQIQINICDGPSYNEKLIISSHPKSTFEFDETSCRPFKNEKLLHSHEIICPDDKNRQKPFFLCQEPISCTDLVISCPSSDVYQDSCELKDMKIEFFDNPRAAKDICYTDVDRDDEIQNMKGLDIKGSKVEIKDEVLIKEITQGDAAPKMESIEKVEIVDTSSDKLIKPEKEVTSIQDKSSRSKIPKVKPSRSKSPKSKHKKQRPLKPQKQKLPTKRKPSKVRPSRGKSPKPKPPQKRKPSKIRPSKSKSPKPKPPKEIELSKVPQSRSKSPKPKPPTKRKPSKVRPSRGKSPKPKPPQKRKPSKIRPSKSKSPKPKPPKEIELSKVPQSRSKSPKPKPPTKRKPSKVRASKSKSPKPKTPPKSKPSKVRPSRSKSPKLKPPKKRKPSKATPSRSKSPKPKAIKPKKEKSPKPGKVKRMEKKTPKKSKPSKTKKSKSKSPKPSKVKLQKETTKMEYSEETISEEEEIEEEDEEEEEEEKKEEKVKVKEVKDKVTEKKLEKKLEISEPAPHYLKEFFKRIISCGSTSEEEDEEEQKEEVKPPPPFDEEVEKYKSDKRKHYLELFNIKIPSDDEALDKEARAYKQYKGGFGLKRLEST